MSRSVEHATPRAPGGYPELVGRVRAAVERETGPDSVIVMVGKGDPALARLQGRTAWHFPQDETGEYAGHYPATDEDALRQLDELRARGAQFIVFPRPAFWWLDHYTALRRHLEDRCVAVVHDDDCRIYRLSNAERRVSSSPSQDCTPSGERQITALLDALLDPDCGVVVVPGERRTAYPGGGRPVWELEAPDPADPDIDSWIHQASSTGAVALVVMHDERPAQHSRTAFAVRLGGELCRIAQREHLCTLFALPLAQGDIPVEASTFEDEI